MGRRRKEMVRKRMEKKDEEAEAANGTLAAEYDKNEDVDTKKQKTNEDD